MLAISKINNIIKKFTVKSFVLAWDHALPPMAPLYLTGRKRLLGRGFSFLSGRCIFALTTGRGVGRIQRGEHSHLLGKWRPVECVCVCGGEGGGGGNLAPPVPPPVWALCNHSAIFWNSWKGFLQTAVTKRIWGPADFILQIWVSIKHKL